ncbi:GH92 family glycosyl hydrolase [Arcticibacterium luteifluviistationis]|uniref:Glycoside hydrolase family 92 protein n=1 Tax=Arcticibacterium luteifluviistationis TaxID=1784714 RepID=A0A2Z4G7G6_9BACT|nr:GH92 family glycosyl hydrolase [Arcticibacterium luteifluviistationis]AWV97114.1 glycoside hydrolase family 92 protein [Arcticibacterium luteifluviistationis]
MKSLNVYCTKFAAVVLLSLTIFSCKVGQEESQKNDKEYLTDKVYPLLDSENSRWFFFSSASRPFGMVNLSPDNEIDGAWGSGYRYKVDTIKGFSHIHAWQISGLSVMPVTFSEETTQTIYSDFFSSFSHEKEIIKPGYHKVELDRFDIKAELTSSTRVGFHKYAFPKDKQAGILFNLNTMLGPNENLDGVLEKTGESELTGQLVAAPTRRRPRPLTIFFKIELNQPIKSIAKDAKTGNYLVSLNTTDKPVLMKAGISYTSIKNAANNISTELPSWDFDKVVEDSHNQWESLLGRIEIKGGSEQQQRRFYTDLWHGLQGRRIISDVNGAYPDNTGEKFRVGQIPLNTEGKPKFNHYNSDSFWGAQWTLNTLWGLVYPEIMEEFTHSLVQYYKDGGLIPRGPSGGNYTYVMTGASSTPFIVTAIQKGIITEDLEEIYKALKVNHMPDGIMSHSGYEHNTKLGGGLKYYIENGFVPYPIPEGRFGGHQEGASLTMEYSYQDWTLAQLAKKLGHEDDYNYFLKRSKNYQNVFDASTGWMRAKNLNGTWKSNFDPYQTEHGFIESNGAQSTWFVPHDLEGLATLMGGKEKAIDKLNEQFETAEKINFTAGTSHSQELHPEYRRIPINYGNQPSIQTAFVFHKLGKYDLTQYWSRKVVDKAFGGLSPATGYNGDEDQGLMGSLAVIMKMGLFQMNGGTDEHSEYQIGSPIFNEITINLNPAYYTGKKFVIKAKNNSPSNVYVNKVELNQKVISDFTLKHSDITNGGELVLDMSENVGQKTK